MNAILIMAKTPLPNKVKTRLCPPLEPETAAHLYYSFLLDKIEQVRCMEGAHHFLAYTPATEEIFFLNITPPGFTLIRQVGSDLGERLANISNSLFEMGFEKVVILDSDTPNLPHDYIKEGLRRLDDVDVVLGPCLDGGYYLIGMRGKMPELFTGIPWSTRDVTELTEKKAIALGKTVSHIGRWYDVDTVEDLKRLKKDLDLSSHDQKESFCENTCRALSFLNVDIQEISR